MEIPNADQVEQYVQEDFSLYCLDPEFWHPPVIPLQRQQNPARTAKYTIPIVKDRGNAQHPVYPNLLTLIMQQQQMMMLRLNTVTAVRVCIWTDFIGYTTRHVLYTSSRGGYYPPE